MMGRPRLADPPARVSMSLPSSVVVQLREIASDRYNDADKAWEVVRDAIGEYLAKRGRGPKVTRPQVSMAYIQPPAIGAHSEARARKRGQK